MAVTQIQGQNAVGIVDVTGSNALRVAEDTVFFKDSFCYTNQNTALWQQTSSGMTIGYSGGSVTLNNNNSLASGAYAVLKTYKAFPLYNGGDVVCQIHAYYNNSFQVNNAIYFGIGLPGTTGAPTDGVYFQIDPSGTLLGVINYNGTTVTTSLPTPNPNRSHDFTIKLNDKRVEFFIDNTLQQSIYMSQFQPTTGAPSSGTDGYLFFQNTNNALLTTAQTFYVQDAQVYLCGASTNKPWPHALAGLGQMSAQGQSGGTMGSTANYAISTTPGAAVPSTTTAALGVGLGGNFKETVTIAANTDGIISSYQNPPGSSTQIPKNLYITGIRWYSVVQLALTGGPFLYECSLAFGHTSVSLNTGESATSKAPRIMPIGTYFIPTLAVLGSPGANFVHNFTTPIVVQPGEYIQTIVKNVGAQGLLGTILHHIGFEGYFE